jgi:hypothetical protein
MKSLLIFFILISTNISFAESKGALQLHAFVPLVSKTSVTELNKGNQSLFILSNEINSEVLQESQKVEIVGVDQAGLEAHLKKISSNNRTIQYQLLINRLKSTATDLRPIILKISAN